MAKDCPFENEAQLCTTFVAALDDGWTAYAETSGFDILLVRAQDGAQIGIEAKLSLNAKVLTQALPDLHHWSCAETGPDYRAVLVPRNSVQHGFLKICRMLGITVITVADPSKREEYWTPPFSPHLPDLKQQHFDEDWHQWCPSQRCSVPDFIPDVSAGHSAPVALTPWKVKAIKLAILLEERPVTRPDFKALGLSPSRWTDPWTGWLTSTPEGYVRGSTMPDFKTQHPLNYEQIKATVEKWRPPFVPRVKQGALL